MATNRDLPDGGAEPAGLRRETLQRLGLSADEVGVILVDHGSRRDESNRLLDQVAAQFRQATGLPIVELAHMELAEPTLAQAFARAVQQGAKLVVVFPYFLAPGRHWQADIPQLAAQAAASFPGVRHLVTAPLGLHALMLTIMQDRILSCLQRVFHQGAACDVCAQEPGCRLSE
jgi:sirohydrochlorin ferrochelatase